MLKIRRFQTLIFTLLLLPVSFVVMSGQKNSVTIKKTDDSWRLEVNGHPFFIKGVVGDEYLSKVKEYGGNSIRIGWNKKELDEAYRLGLNALVNLPAGAERDGMNYNDTAEISKQTERIVSIVKKTKDHPAVLMWAIGNELDFIPPLDPFNPRVWDAVNQAAKAIHAIDPDHPVMTVIGTSMMGKVADIVKRCPDLNLLGINTYGDIYTLPVTLEKYGWTKPYLISEWGPDGYWEVRKTIWGAPYEQTGLEKYLCYEKKYKSAMNPVNGKCLGSYVFYWSGFKQETTHTWMHYMWSGEKPDNAAPLVDSLNIGKYVRYQQIVLDRGTVQSAMVTADDIDNDKLTYKWEIKPEARYAAYAGQGEAVPQPLPNLIKGQAEKITFVTPSEPGAYRLFVYVYDGKGHFSTGNLPFYTR
jgi:Glycosyl hydrolases family 2, TIM barrel domain